MRRFGVVAAFAVVVGLLASGRWFPADDRPALAITPQGEGSDGPPDPDSIDPGGIADEPVWVAIDFVDLEGGGSSEYFGQVGREALDALVGGRLRGYLRLDDVFWLYDDGEVERLDDDLAYGKAAYFRVEDIRRITELKDGFPEAARQLTPGDRIVPGPGRDA